MPRKREVGLIGRAVSRRSSHPLPLGGRCLQGRGAASPLRPRGLPACYRQIKASRG